MVRKIRRNEVNLVGATKVMDRIDVDVSMANMPLKLLNHSNSIASEENSSLRQRRKALAWPISPEDISRKS